MRTILLAAALVSGCAPTLNGANEVGGMIANFTANRSAAFDLAQKHCEKFNKSARMTKASDWDDTATFECL